VQLLQNFRWAGTNINTPESFSITIGPDAMVVNGDTNVGDITLPAPIHVTATALDPENHPAAGASVALDGFIQIQPTTHCRRSPRSARRTAQRAGAPWSR
jgi:hypothetical protein